MTLVAPSQGRGSKLSQARNDRDQLDRRPLTGARIETARAPGHHQPCASPPHRGADRNQCPGCGLADIGPVAPSQGRGSKRAVSARARTSRSVAPSQGRGSKPGTPVGLGTPPARRPLTGARIETSHPDRRRVRRRVAPSQGRGSKQVESGGKIYAEVVAPSQGRGSKPKWAGQGRSSLRRPLTGARIETVTTAPLVVPMRSSPPHRGADRNRCPCKIPPRAGRRPLTGARIETHWKKQQGAWHVVAPSQGRGSKHQHHDHRPCPHRSPPHRGADRNGSGH